MQGRSCVRLEGPDEEKRDEINTYRGGEGERGRGGEGERGRGGRRGVGGEGERGRITMAKHTKMVATPDSTTSMDNITKETPI